MNGTSSSSTATGSDGSFPTSVRWRIVLLLTAFSFMNWFNRKAFSIAALDPAFEREFALSPESVGAINSAMLLIYTICMTPGGWLIDWRGPWRALTAVGFGTGVAVCLTTVPGLEPVAGLLALPAFFAARMILGFFSAPIYPATGRAVSHWLPFSQRAAVMGLILGAAPFGLSVSSIFAYPMDRLGWRAALLITGAVTLVIALLWRLYATDYPSQHRGVNASERKRIGPELARDGSVSAPVATAEGARWTDLLRSRSIVFLALCYATVGYFEYLFYFWMDYYFSKVLKLQPEDSTFFGIIPYAAIPYLPMALGMPVGGWLCDRLMRTIGIRAARRAVTVGGMLFAAAMLGCGVLASHPQWIVVWFSLALFACGTVEGPIWTTAFDIGGRRGATAGAIVNTAGNLGGMPAPYVTAVVGGAVGRYTNNELFGWQCSLLLGGAICLSGVFLWIWINAEDRVDRETAA